MPRGSSDKIRQSKKVGLSRMRERAYAGNPQTGKTSLFSSKKEVLKKVLTARRKNKFFPSSFIVFENGLAFEILSPTKRKFRENIFMRNLRHRRTVSVKNAAPTFLSGRRLNSARKAPKRFTKDAKDSP